ncbi:MAG: hypothetical protein HXS41_01565 [Theionarchaea archaeon]|nr:hypothetical protein [Theionarchaea archaeon]MBU7001511.1 hypothetical protein [Theionarchaea archaeon]MBU7019716.1 hypothetical protein [Theionarchaea archaeon]MBU7034427.1 hypothetical protein [Theionarchaea archaeon]MBU7040638.1 hypothetical protein [Theionarchaea archaeon]
MTHKWFVIAQSDYRARTSSIRSIRRYFPFIMLGILAVFVLYIAPALIDLFTDELVAFLLSQVAVAFVPILFLMFFLIFIWFPITLMLRDVRSEQQVLLLSAPVNPRDILLGEFLGELPLYIIIMTIFTGFITALFDPLGVTNSQKAVIVTSFMITLSSALWIGTVIAALLRTRLGRSSRSKDVAKALSLMLVVPLVAVVYAFLGGNVLERLADPEAGTMIRNILRIFPSSWAAGIVTQFAAHPGTIGLEVVPRLAGSIVFLGGSFWIGMRLAGRAYSAEITTFTAAQVGPDGAFYRFVNYIGGKNSFGILLTSTFKTYVRRFQNLSWIVYIVALAALMNIFLMKPQDLFPVFLTSSFIFPLLAVAVASDMTLRGKETFFLYKKVPSGVGKLIKTRVVQGWLIVPVVAGVLMAVSVKLIPGTTVTSGVIYTGAIILYAAAHTILALGMFLLRPAYDERGSEFMLNMMIPAQGSAFFVLGSLIMFGEKGVFYLVIPVVWAVGIGVLLMGKRRFSRME